MNKYTGVPCPICSKAFKNGDDIVVCPDCGAPHHRACYKEHGYCAFTEQHASGVFWKNPNEGTPAPPAGHSKETLPCPRCNNNNEVGSLFCRTCGIKLDTGSQQIPNYQGNFQSQGGYQPNMNTQQSQRAAQFGIGLEDEIGGVPVKEVAQFVGENTFYYLPRFKLFDMVKNAVSVNFSAIIFNFFYYFNRKMYKIGTILLALFVLSMVPNLLLVYYTFPDIMESLIIANAPPVDFTPYSNLLMISNILHYVYLAVCMGSGFFANKIYYRFVTSRVRDIKKDYNGRPENEYAQALAIGGRTNKILVVALGIALLVAYILFYVLLLTTYQIL
ncbi:RING finger protein [Hydrogenoanaerobacterium sp.]|uniref:RING finger protein n=1 Tax=Hydrogenoanaerobacterium sp. TaxID=2953763 RepID=UPI00289ABADA|nr:RING finger protein [Hydrogenoanaerobacterium sp.]